MQLVYEFSWQKTSQKQQPTSSLPSENGADSQQAPALPSEAEATQWEAQSAPQQESQAAAQLQTDTASVSQTSMLSPQQMAASYPIAALPCNTARAVSALQDGQVIALPTDTLYGLAADANSSKGIQQIYSIKRRQAAAPLAICLADVADLGRYCHAQHLPEQLLQQLLPGPVTLILARKEQAPLCAELNSGLQSIGEPHLQTGMQFTCHR